MITFAFWKINPRYIEEFHEKGGFNDGNAINPSLAKKIMDTIVPLNKISEHEAASLLTRELVKLEEPETRDYLSALMGDDSEAIKEMIKSEKVSKPFVLLSAAAFNAGNTAKLMLANETDINAADPDGWTPLLVACTHNMADMAWYLVNNGADINKKSQYGTTALMLAVANSNFQVAQLLIQKGALVNERMFDYTALRFARDIDRQDIVELLLTSGATE